MQDYMVFGAGWNGEVKEDHDDLDVKIVITRPVVMAAGGDNRIPEPTKRHHFKVFVFINPENNLRYNVAADVLPVSEDIIRAINVHNPCPVPARSLWEPMSN
ncbi:TPA: hypothetical protein OT866_000781 [Klebsiella aerogenes]|nr:hypothetical protein [Klebsiella aerogenes]